MQPVSVLQTEYSIFKRAVEAEILPTIRELAGEKGIEVTQLALAWLLAQGQRPLPGRMMPQW